MRCRRVDSSLEGLVGVGGGGAPRQAPGAGAAAEDENGAGGDAAEGRRGRPRDPGPRPGVGVVNPEAGEDGHKGSPERIRGPPLPTGVGGGVGGLANGTPPPQGGGGSSPPVVSWEPAISLFAGSVQSAALSQLSPLALRECR